MSPKKAILRELTRTYEQSGGEAYTHPPTIAGFSAQPEKYQKAVNELLQARLVDGHKDSEGRMAIAINSHRLTDVKREIRPLWAKPAVWATAVIMIVAAAWLGLGLGA